MAAMGWVCLLSLALLSCVPRTRHLRSIEAKQAEHEQRLAHLKSEISDAEARAQTAKVEASFQECRAAAARVRSGFAQRVAECARTTALAAQCDANQAKHESNSLVVGCGLGLLGSIVTAGAATPWLLAGCGGGALYGESTRPACEVPTCVEDHNAWLVNAAREAGRAGLPLCNLGVDIVQEQYAVVGQQVTSVEDGTPAARIGMDAGDILFLAGDSLVTSNEVVVRAKQQERALLCFARGWMSFCSFVEPRQEDDSRVLGYRYEPVPAQASLEVIRVMDVHDGPGRKAGLRAEDVIMALDDQGIEYLAQMDQGLEIGTHSLLVLRGDKPYRLTLVITTPPPRTTPSELDVFGGMPDDGE